MGVIGFFCSNNFKVLKKQIDSIVLQMAFKDLAYEIIAVS